MRGNLNYHISETEGRTKLKFGEVNRHICQNFFAKKPSKKFFDLIGLLRYYLVPNCMSLDQIAADHDDKWGWFAGGGVLGNHTWSGKMF